MGLIANGYRLGHSPFCYRVGIALPSFYANSMRARDVAGAIRAQRNLFGNLAALPQGSTAPGSWMLPQQAGGLSSHNRCALAVGASGQGALGRNLIANGTLTLDAAAIGGLVAGGVGAAQIALTAAGAIVATIGTTGAATIVIGAVASPGALGWLVGQSEVSLTAELVAYALGHMVGTTQESGELTPAGIAAAVWQALAADFNAPGTAGNKLNSASAAGDPWTAELPGAYPPGSAGDIVGNLVGGLTPDQDARLALCEAILRNKTVTDPETGTLTVYAADGTTPLLTAQLYEDTAGTQAYRSRGIERRERLA